MKSDSENFGALRKIMALKRHEQPPPGYMHHLPGTIISRIERGEGRLNFWERFSGGFVLRPGLAYAFGLTICGAVAVSAVYNVRRQPAEVSEAPVAGFAMGGLQQPAEASAGQVFQSPLTLHVADWPGNSNTFVSSDSEPSLFAPISHAVPVNFERGN